MPKKQKSKKLYRSKKDRILSGVSAGIGEYAKIDPNIIRLLWVFAAIFSHGLAIIAYIIAWIILPEK
jgi:phage shock protein PspC (stress-responsive transcriptional regulator)